MNDDSVTKPMVDLRLPIPWAKRYPAIVVHVDPEMLEQIDRWAVRERVSRSEAVRTFVRWPLDGRLSEDPKGAP